MEETKAPRKSFRDMTKEELAAYQAEMKASKSIIKKKEERVYTLFKCDHCGQMFEGQNAQAEYQQHVASINWNKIEMDWIVNPQTMECVVTVWDEEDFEKPVEPEGLEKAVKEMKTVDDVLKAMDEVAGDNETKMSTIYLCPACKEEAKMTQIPKEFDFDTLEEFDQHMWDKHNLAVKRDEEQKVVSVKTVSTGEVLYTKEES